MTAAELLQPTVKWTEQPELYAKLTGIPVEKILDKLKEQ